MRLLIQSSHGWGYKRVVADGLDRGKTNEGQKRFYPPYPSQL